MRYPELPGVRFARHDVGGGIELDVMSAGPEDGPLLVLAHGFPECAWSWRHQLAPLAAAGWHVLAPDQRGYGGSSRPAAISAYGTDHLSADLLALVDRFGGKDAQAVFVGHDWGALLVWDLAREQPERCRAVMGVSVPFVNWPAPPTAVFRQVYGDTFFYILYFQEPPAAEQELGGDPRTTMRRILYSASGDVPASELMVSPTPRPAASTGFLDVMIEPPAGYVSSWCSPEDLDVYTAAFTESGFFGPVSWYRNLDANYARVKDHAPTRLTMPVGFIGGSRDPVISRDQSGIDRMRAELPGFRSAVMLEGAGHWTQQEQPEEFNAALLAFLADV
jgi:pimeloyl-ACP methyl ester carboxylesterase